MAKVVRSGTKTVRANRFAVAEFRFVILNGDLRSDQRRVRAKYGCVRGSLLFQVGQFLFQHSLEAVLHEVDLGDVDAEGFCCLGSAPAL